MAEIMILEPDVRTALRVHDALSGAGHVCCTAATIADGLQCIRSSQRLLTILNARMPWTESIGLMQQLEERGWPVLFITADASNAAHLRALYQAGCDVLLSPFQEDELCRSVEQLLSESARTLTLGSLRLDTENREATLDGEQLTLTAQEFALLTALMRSPDAALTRQELLRTAWGYQGIGETRTVDVHIQRLRCKLGASCIETVYKLGYRLKMA
ncbi:MAG: response regulator transcription factor [Clostridia bacterium]|nr:response regulator transcription factor [Clostridia bacterium]